VVRCASIVGVSTRPGQLQFHPRSDLRASNRRSKVMGRGLRASLWTAGCSWGVSSLEGRRSRRGSALPHGRRAAGAGPILVGWSSAGLLVTIHTSNGVEAPGVARGWFHRCCGGVGRIEPDLVCCACGVRDALGDTAPRGRCGSGEARGHSDGGPGPRRSPASVGAAAAAFGVSPRP
jgi:hypothetical protein